jgi:hypothetical protein
VQSTARSESNFLFGHHDLPLFPFAPILTIHLGICSSTNSPVVPDRWYIRTLLIRSLIHHSQMCPISLRPPVCLASWHSQISLHSCPAVARMAVTDSSTRTRIIWRLRQKWQSVLLYYFTVKNYIELKSLSR